MASISCVTMTMDFLITQFIHHCGIEYFDVDECYAQNKHMHSVLNMRIIFCLYQMSVSYHNKLYKVSCGDTSRVMIVIIGTGLGDFS